MPRLHEQFLSDNFYTVGRLDLSLKISRTNRLLITPCFYISGTAGDSLSIQGGKAKNKSCNMIGSGCK